MEALHGELVCPVAKTHEVGRRPLVRLVRRELEGEAKFSPAAAAHLPGDEAPDVIVVLSRADRVSLSRIALLQPKRESLVAGASLLWRDASGAPADSRLTERVGRYRVSCRCCGGAGLRVGGAAVCDGGPG